VAKVENLQKLVATLRRRAAAADEASQASVVVGYTASYALFVHENMEMKLKGQPRPSPHHGRYWDPQDRAQPKFLEAPARYLQPELRKMIKDALAHGQTTAQALLQAGLRLQRESQLLVPVDTGALKASAFTRLE
jgi:hypothetical protein